MGNAASSTSTIDGARGGTAAQADGARQHAAVPVAGAGASGARSGNNPRMRMRSASSSSHSAAPSTSYAHRPRQRRRSEHLSSSTGAGVVSGADSIEWDPEEETQLSRRVRARLADAILTMSTSPTSRRTAPESAGQGERQAGGARAAGVSTGVQTEAPPSPLAFATAAAEVTSTSSSSRQQAHSEAAPLPTSAAAATAQVSGAGDRSQEAHGGLEASSTTRLGQAPSTAGTSPSRGRVIAPLPRQAHSRQESRGGPSPTSADATSPDPTRSRRRHVDPLNLPPPVGVSQEEDIDEHATLGALVMEIFGGVAPALPPASAEARSPPSDTSSAAGLPPAQETQATGAGPEGSSPQAGDSTPADGATGSDAHEGSSAGGRRPEAQREIRTGTSIIVQGALYTRTAPRRRGSRHAQASASHSAARQTPSSQTGSAAGRSRSTSLASSFAQHRHSRPSHRLVGEGTHSSSPASSQAQSNDRTEADGWGSPTPEERAEVLIRLLRVAAAATAVPLVSRAEGLPPPSTATFMETMDMATSGSVMGTPGPGASPRREGTGSPAVSTPSTNSGRGHTRSRSLANSLLGERSSSSNTLSSSVPGGSSASSSSSSPISAHGISIAIRSLLQRRRRRSLRPMQRSASSLDLLAEVGQAPFASNAIGGSAAPARASSTQSMSSSSGRYNPWVEPIRQAVRRSLSTFSSSDNANAGAGNAVPPSVRDWDSSRRSLDASVSPAAPHRGPRASQGHTSSRSMDDEAVMGLPGLMAATLQQPMPSQIQRGRTRALPAQVPSAASSSDAPASTGTSQPSSAGASPETPHGADARPPGRMRTYSDRLRPGIRVDVRDSAAAISAFLDRARAGITQEESGAQDTFSRYLDCLGTDLVAAMREMDLDQERQIRILDMLRRRGNGSATAAGEGQDGDESMARASAGEVPVQESGRTTQNAHSSNHGFALGLDAESAFDSTAFSTRQRRRGDVTDGELSFFRMFCFPRPNQAGVAHRSQAPRPSATVPPPGASSTGTGSEFVLHPDLIPCVMVGIRSVTTNEEPSGDDASPTHAPTHSADAGAPTSEDRTGTTTTSPPAEQRPSTAQGSSGWPSWMRRFGWPAGSPSTSPSPPNTQSSTPLDADGDTVMHGTEEASSRTAEAATAEGGQASMSTSDSQDNDILPPRSWRFVLWVSGGFWPRSHPLLQAPPAMVSRDVMLLIELISAMSQSGVAPAGLAQSLAQGDMGRTFPPGAAAAAAAGMGFPLPPGGGSDPGSVLLHLFEQLANHGQSRRRKATPSELAKSAETRLAKGWELSGKRRGGGSAGHGGSVGGGGASGSDDVVVSERVAEKRRELDGISLVAEGVVLESTAQSCLICLEDWEDEDDVRILSCKHAFHSACVDRWLTQRSNTCPLCRKTGVTKENETATAI